MGEKGKYICIDGVDGAGKSEFCRVLATKIEFLSESTKVAEFCFPSVGPVGMLIRGYLRGTYQLKNPRALLYLYAADGEERDPYIRDALKRGVHVICDRHPVLPSMVYQQDLHDYFALQAVTEKVVRPDLLVVLDVPPEVSLERCRARAKYADVVFEKDVTEEELGRRRKRYRELANAAVSRGWASSSQLLDGRGDPDELADTVVTLAGLR